VVSAHIIATLPSAPAARKVSAAVALANPPPSNRKSTKGISFECTWFRPFPDGNVVLLTRLYEGQEATVLQLPAETRVPVEVKKQEVGLIAV